VRPLVGISGNRFRGQKELSIASLLPDVVAELGLSREHDYSLNFGKQGERIAEFVSWQDAYDQGRRRQKANSAGVVLRVRRSNFQAYVQQGNWTVAYIATLRRTADKYVPENQMHWRRFSRIFSTTVDS